VNLCEISVGEGLIYSDQTMSHRAGFYSTGTKNPYRISRRKESCLDKPDMAQRCL